MFRTALSSQERSSESQLSQVLPARRTNCSTWRRWLPLRSGWLASSSGLNDMIPLTAQDSTLQWAALCTSLSLSRSTCKLLDTHAAQLARLPVLRFRVTKGRTDLLG